MAKAKTIFKVYPKFAVCGLFLTFGFALERQPFIRNGTHPWRGDLWPLDDPRGYGFRRRDRVAAPCNGLHSAALVDRSVDSVSRLSGSARIPISRGEASFGRSCHASLPDCTTWPHYPRVGQMAQESERRRWQNATFPQDSASP